MKNLKGLSSNYLFGNLCKKNLIMRFLILLLFLPLKGITQLSFETIKMSKSVEETSGLEILGNYLITHNDSGDKPKLYIINQEGEKIMEIEINQLKNNDWEDIAADSENYYIADTGNNYGTRENLKIYILDKDFFLQGKISIRYQSQTTFSRQLKNKYDAEALAVVGDHLVLFSKNRKNSKI
jgi:RNA-binding protein YhbY